MGRDGFVPLLAACSWGFFPPTERAWDVIGYAFRAFPVVSPLFLQIVGTWDTLIGRSREPGGKRGRYLCLTEALTSTLLSEISDWDADFIQFTLASLSSGRLVTPMGRTSIISNFNFPGRYAWAAAEVVGPLNLLYVLFSLPEKLKPQPHSASSVLGTGLPLQHEILGCLYVVHYINRAIITPLFIAPSMSPIHASVTVMMSTFQFINSANLGCWIVYSARDKGGENDSPLLSLLSVLGFVLYFGGLAGNIVAENKLFSLRRGAAKRKAKSEGRAVVTYDKVYTIPPVEGLYTYVLFPHYVLEWVEWAGFWIVGGAWGLGWGNESAALWFLINEIAAMLPRAYDGKHWYEDKFGKRAVAGRAGAIPLLGL